jgi:hypothetical protein
VQYIPQSIDPLDFGAEDLPAKDAANVRFAPESGHQGTDIVNIGNDSVGRVRGAGRVSAEVTPAPYLN